MARFKNHLFVVLGFVFAGAIGAAFGTGTAQAVVSTLVSVVNPTTSPVLNSSVDEPGRDPYQFTVQSQPCFVHSCSVTSPTIPAGKRLVIQQYSIAGVVTGASFLEAALGLNATTVSFFAPPAFGNLFAFDPVVLAYADAGSTVSVSVNTDGGFGTSAFFSVTGYLVDCTVSHCAPIAP